MKTIFVAGIHGVGKTTMCERIAQEFGLMHRSCSQLIREAEAAAIAIGSKAVDDIEGNQRLLIDAVANLRKADQNLLLDGHFTLLNAEQQIEKLPPAVFTGLCLDAIILVHDEPEIIAGRLTERDSINVNAVQIKAHQDTEIEHASEVADLLRSAIFTVSAFDDISFCSTIRTILQVS